MGYSTTLAIITVVFIISLVAFFGYLASKTAEAHDDAKKKQAEEAEALALAEQKQREKDEYFKKIDAFYCGCCKRKIVEWDSDKSEIILVARNMLNDSSLSELDIQKCFELGRERYEVTEREKRDAARQQEHKKIQAEKKRAELVGKEKYYKNTFKQMKICKKLVDDWNKRIELEAQLVVSAGMKPEPKSTVASATINGALFGTAAGVAAADRTRARNESAQATYNSLQNTLLETFSKSTEEDIEAVRAKGFLGELERFKEAIDSSVCSDDKDSQEYFEFLQVSVKKKKFSKSHRNLVATIEIEVGCPEFLNTYAILDGSIRLVAKLNERTIGEGYLCGAGFGDTCYKYQLGFHGYLMSPGGTYARETYKTDVLIELHDDVELTTIRGVSVEVEPYHLWLLEGDDPIIIENEEE